MRIRWPLMVLLLALSAMLAIACGGQVTTNTATPGAPEATAVPLTAEEVTEILSEALSALESDEVDLEDALATLTEALEDLDTELLDLGALGIDLELFDLSSLVDGGTLENLDVGEFDLGNPSGAGGGRR